MSRSTLRAAMQILVKEGLLRTSKGKPAEILSIERITGSQNKPHTIGILSPSLGASTLYQQQLHERLYHLGFQVEPHTGARFYRKNAGKALEELVRTRQVDCWILLHSTAEMQHWFSQRALPAIIDGTAYEGINLPAIDIDYRAICRHAVGTLLRSGHRRIALLVPKSGTGGVKRCEQGFLEGMHASSSNETLPRIIHSPSSTEELRVAMDRLFSSNRPPTAIIIEQPMDLFTVLTHLMNTGHNISRDLSLIALSDVPAMKHLVPAIARYSFTPDLYARHLTQIILKVINKEALAEKQRFIIPSYVKGHSLGPCRDR